MIMMYASHANRFSIPNLQLFLLSRLWLKFLFSSRYPLLGLWPDGRAGMEDDDNAATPVSGPSLTPPSPPPLPPPAVEPNPPLLALAPEELDDLAEDTAPPVAEGEGRTALEGLFASLDASRDALVAPPRRGRRIRAHAMLSAMVAANADMEPASEVAADGDMGQGVAAQAAVLAIEDGQVDETLAPIAPPLRFPGHLDSLAPQVYRGSHTCRSCRDRLFRRWSAYRSAPRQWMQVPPSLSSRRWRRAL